MNRDWDTKSESDRGLFSLDSGPDPTASALINASRDAIARCVYGKHSEFFDSSDWKGKDCRKGPHAFIKRHVARCVLASMCCTAECCC